MPYPTISYHLKSVPREDEPIKSDFNNTIIVLKFCNN